MPRKKGVGINGHAGTSGCRGRHVFQRAHRARWMDSRACRPHRAEREEAFDPGAMWEV